MQTPSVDWLTRGALCRYRLLIGLPFDVYNREHSDEGVGSSFASERNGCSQERPMALPFRKGTRQM